MSALKALGTGFQGRPRGLCVLGAFVLCVLVPLWTDAAQVHAAPGDDLFEEALRFAKRFDPATDPDACRVAFDALQALILGDIEAATKASGKPLSAEQTIGILNRRILKDRRVTYLSNQYWRDSLFTAALVKKKGNCVSTSLLYHLLSRRLNLPVRLTVVPEHVLVRWEDERGAHNIETTDGGRLITQDDLLRKYRIERADREEAGFGRSLTDDEARAELLKTWADTAGLIDENDAALSMLEEAGRLWPENRLITLHRANQLRSMGRGKEAEAIVGAVLDGTRSAYVACYAGLLLSNILENGRRFDEAIEVARKALRNAGRNQVARLSEQLGRLYRHKREFDRAIAYHQMAADLRNDAFGYGSLGSVLTEAGKYKEAIAAYERSVALNPEDPFPRVILAGLHERTGDKAKGRALFASVERPRGSTLTWLGALVWYYAVVEDDARLFENMEAALRADPSGALYNYFVREPELDRHRKKPKFVEIMKRYGPKR